MKTQYFHTKLPCQMSMLKQIEWDVQNWPITRTFATDYSLLMKI